MDKLPLSDTKENMPGANSPEKQNPLVLLPAAQRISKLSPELRLEWKNLCLELAAQAAEKGDYNWSKRKYMNAAYWRVVAVYARHAARLSNVNAVHAKCEKK